MRLLAIAAHADDETLGCGGTLLRHGERGDEIHWVVVTDAYAGDRWTDDVLAAKKSQVERVAEAYGVASLTCLGHPAGGLDRVPVGELMKGLAAVVERSRPDAVYVVHPGDVHTDHERCFTATMSVLKPFRLTALGVRCILAYETLSSTEAAPRPSFAPNVYFDITGRLDDKLEILSLYATEAQAEPLPRSPSAVAALARFRGATIGVEHAEAMTLIRAVA